MSKQEALFTYCLRIADNSLILGHRLSEWCGHGPILEEDIALTNMALDKVGQARLLYQYACELEGKGRTEDDLAYRRAERRFHNTLLAEQPNGDYAHTLVRSLLNDVFDRHLYEALSGSKDATLAAFAAKSLKEVTYHVRHVSQWVIRLGDGTPESHERVQNALQKLWPYTGELFATDETDSVLIREGIAADLGPVRKKWEKDIAAVLQEATLEKPENGWMQSGARLEGRHSEHLGFILAEMQYLQRAYPDAKW